METTEFIKLAQQASKLMKGRGYHCPPQEPNSFYFFVHKDDDVFAMLEILSSNGFNCINNGNGKLFVILKPVITSYTK